MRQGKRPPEAPSKLSKIPFEGYEGWYGRRFLEQCPARRPGQLRIRCESPPARSAGILDQAIPLVPHQRQPQARHDAGAGKPSDAC